MSNKTRFDLEQEILGCWHITDDIGVMLNAMENPEFDEDERMNFLIGLRTIYNAKFEQLFATFEGLISEGKVK